MQSPAICDPATDPPTGRSINGGTRPPLKAGVPNGDVVNGCIA
eukprot:gene12605-biopygen7950